MNYVYCNETDVFLQSTRQALHLLIVLASAFRSITAQYHDKVNSGGRESLSMDEIEHCGLKLTTLVPPLLRRVIEMKHKLVVVECIGCTVQEYWVESSM